MKLFNTLGAVSLATIGLMVACEHEVNVSTTEPAATRPGPMRLGVTSPQAADYDASVVDQMTTARCDRDEACSDVGVGRKYASRRECADQVHSRFANDINPTNCAHGLYRVMLDRCMAAIKDEPCDRPSGANARVDWCTSATLCLE
jgi:hypothetical protein